MKNISLGACLMPMFLQHSIFTLVNKDASGYCLSFFLLVMTPFCCNFPPLHSMLSVTGMRVLHWCMLGVTLLLLCCEVAISQACHSLIMLVDGFHTFLILMRMALNQAGVKKPPPSSSDSPAPPPHASSSSSAAQSESSVKPPPGTQTLPDQPQPELSPPALDCSLSYSDCRIQSLGTFITALCLTTLCLSYFLEVGTKYMALKPTKQPLLLVVVTAVSLVHKMLMLWLNWDHQQAPDTESHVEVNHKGNVTLQTDDTFTLAVSAQICSITICASIFWSYRTIFSIS